MLKKKSFYLSILISLQLPMLCMTGNASEFAFQRQFEQSPPPFEKFYVDNSIVVSTPEGTFIKLENGQLERVRALMTDVYGTYVIRIHTQCPLCGSCYNERHCPEGCSCPLYDKEILPGLWGSP